MANFYNPDIFTIDLIKYEKENILKMAFGKDRSDTKEIVASSEVRVKSLAPLAHGKLLKIDGACPLAVMSTIIPYFSNIVPAIAVYDPRTQCFIITVSKSPDYFVGNTLS